MVTPIRPSLAQMLQTPAATPKLAGTPQQAQGFNAALAAQKAFFQQVSGAPAAQKITPPTYTAADIEKASAVPAQPDTDAPPKRPGSFLNIVV
ncbi:MAG: hypothetical protein ACXU8U_03560 [Asticcacaulis sp.]